MKRVSIIVRAEWDEEAKVWVATSEDIEGLAVEAGNFESLREKVLGAICDLVELNGFEGNGSLPDIPVHIMSEQMTRIPNPCH